MAFSLNIKTDNAAFCDSDAADCQRKEGDDLAKYIEAANEDAARVEVARILRDIARKLEAGHDSGVCLDANGNNVGTWSL